jgi:hypothetical protein
MHRLALLLALAGSGAAGLIAAPATAQQRTVTVTLLGGRVVTLAVEVPPGTVLDKVVLPDVTTPVVAITNGKVPVPAGAVQPVVAKVVHKHRHHVRHAKRAVKKVAQLVARAHRRRHVVGPPSPSNPTFSLALPGPAPVGVPDAFIDRFRVPPFLLAIYQAAGIQYGVRWEILAAINEIETDYGRNLRTSPAGAVGWMQFLPSSWRRWGVDANNDGRKDPYNPVDAIFSAARYLRAADAEHHLRQAIFAYNHAGWYVDSVLLRARMLGGLPADLVGSLTGLTQGLFPVHARAVYADERRAATRVFARAGAAVIAVQDGKIVRLGRGLVVLRDAYGNTYTYSGLKKVAKAYPAPKTEKVTRAQIASELQLPAPDPKPTEPASAGVGRPVSHVVQRVLGSRPVRLFANPARPAALPHGGRQQLLDSDQRISRYTVTRGLRRSDVRLRPLRVGSRVSAGTILGRIGTVSRRFAPHLLFQIRPAGRGAPLIDPKPILDGWKLLEKTALYRVAHKNPFAATSGSIGQILLSSKEQLAQRVLADPRIKIYSCGRQDIRAGVIDRRVLATLEFLAASGLDPTVTALRCGHGYYTKAGNVSEHSFGDAVDIAAINDIPILGHQGPGSIADITVRRLLTLQGTMKPHQIITLMTYQGTDNTLAMADHADHIHVGFRPLYGSNTKLGHQLAAILKPHQWIRLIDRIRTIGNPSLR